MRARYPWHDVRVQHGASVTWQRWAEIAQAALENEKLLDCGRVGLAVTEQTHARGVKPGGRRERFQKSRITTHWQHVEHRPDLVLA